MLIFVSTADFSFEKMFETDSYLALEMNKCEPHVMLLIPGSVLWIVLKVEVTVDPDVRQAREPQVLYSVILSFKVGFLFIRADKTLGLVNVNPVLCLVAQSCPTLCDPMDCSPPGSSVHGIFQARIQFLLISVSIKHNMITLYKDLHFMQIKLSKLLP